MYNHMTNCCSCNRNKNKIVFAELQDIEELLCIHTDCEMKPIQMLFAMNLGTRTD